MEHKVFFKQTKIISAEYNHKWKVDDKRRKIFYVEFCNGTVWYPKDVEIKEIVEKRQECFEHNIKYPNIDPK